jgi:hypothetical protein
MRNKCGDGRGVRYAIKKVEDITPAYGVSGVGVSPTYLEEFKQVPHKVVPISKKDFYTLTEVSVIVRRTKPAVLADKADGALACILSSTGSSYRVAHRALEKYVKLLFGNEIKADDLIKEAYIVKKFKIRHKNRVINTEE